MAPMQGKKSPVGIPCRPNDTVGTHTQLATENIDGDATGFSGFYAIWRLSEQVPSHI